MMRAVVLFTCLLLVIGCGPHSERDGAGFKIAEVIPKGRVRIEILKVQFNKRAEELGAKLASGIASNRNWYFEVVKTNSGPLPYHPNLGLSEEEHREYLVEAEKRNLVVANVAEIIFNRAGDFVTVDVGDFESPFSKLKLNVKTGILECSVGVIGPPEWRKVEEGNRPLGPYEGYKWHYEKSDLNTLDVRIVSLDIFRRKTTGKIFWRLKDSATERGNAIRQFDVVFQHEPPASR